MPGEGGVVVEGDGRAQPWIEPPEDGHHHRHGLGGGLTGQAGREHEPGLALLEHQHRPSPPADQQVTLPVPGIFALLDGRGPVVDGAPLGDSGARLASPPPAALGTTTRQQPPELLPLLPGPMKEGVNGLGRDRAQLALLAPLEPAGNLLWRPALQQALTYEPPKLGILLQDGRPLSTFQVAAFRVDRQVAAFGQRVAAQLAADRRGCPAEPGRDRPQAEPLGLQRGQPLPLLQRQMCPVRHRPIPDCRSRPGRYHNAPGCCTSCRTPPSMVVY